MANQTQNDDKNSTDQAGPSYSDFPLPTYEEWRKEVDRVLKGAPFDKRMVTRTYEGIALQPMYQEAQTADLAHLDSLPGFPPYVRSTEPLGYKGKVWDTAQELRCSTARELNAALRSDLERGQNAINLVLDRATRFGLDADEADAQDIGEGGVSLSTLADLAEALDKVDLERLPILVQAGAMALPITAMLTGFLRQNVKSLENLRGCVGADPLGNLAREGSLPHSVVSAYDLMASLTNWAKSRAPQLQTILIQGSPYHDGGANATQELGYGVATGVEYLRELQARGLSVDDVAPRMRFSFSIGSNFFMEIAKLRAARMLWARIVKEFGGSEQSQKMSVHCRTSEFNKTIYDPYVNMLRTTTEAFSGVLGGADSMHVGPFDEVIRTPDEFSRRISRNTHTILSEECHVPRTIDAAGGSWYVESLTDAVARGAWEIFQGVEKQGGMLAALQSGSVQSEIAKVAEARAKSYATRKDVVVGSNMYANMTEEPIDLRPIDRAGLKQDRATQLARQRESVDQDWRESALDKLADASGERVVEAAVHALDGGATLGEISRALGDGDGASVEPVRIHRGADQYEALRNATEEYTRRTGERPKVFLANMGPVPQHKARADFARGFLEVGAFDVVGTGGFSDPGSAAKAAVDSGAPAVVICSTDPTYPEIVPPLTVAIKVVKPDTMVLVAGYPAEHVESFKDAGVDDFIHVRANCLALLSSLQKRIGAQQ